MVKMEQVCGEAISLHGDQVRWIVEKYYDIGELHTLHPILKGMVNQSYQIDSIKNDQQDSYLFRKYHSNTSLEAIQFEHALLNKLENRQFLLTPQIVPAKNGEGFLLIKELNEGYIAMFSFLPGDSKYEWNTPLDNNQELTSVATKLAEYHQCIGEWQVHKNAPSYVDQMPTKVRTWHTQLTKNTSSLFEEYLLRQYDDLYHIATSLSQDFASIPMRQLPKLTVHFDYHAGNLLFENNDVVGIVDFHYSTLDYRIFDIGRALMFFCTEWDNTCHAAFSFERMKFFLNAYQSAWSSAAWQNPNVRPLTHTELLAIPKVIVASMFYELEWYIDDFYGDTSEINDGMSHTNTMHLVKLIQWSMAHQTELETCSLLSVKKISTKPKPS